MKFLLVAINAKYIHSNPAVYSLKAYAGEKYKDVVDIAEYTINQKIEDIIEDIVVRKPDVIGISCYIWNFSVVSLIVPELGKILKDVPIWLGGPEVSYQPYDEIFSKMDIAGIMCGEGEKVFLRLLQKYMSKDNCFDMDGIVTKENMNFSACETDISELPFIYKNIADFKNRIVYYESQRGCPFSCSYCLSSIDKKIRLRDMELVKKELDFFIENKVPQVKFIDRTFNAKHEHAMEIWKYIKEHDNSVTNFHFEIAADILKDDEILLLNSMRNGLVQLEIGVQSFNEKTLRAVNRYTNLNLLSDKVKRLRSKENINLHLDLIAGLPYEDLESFKDSFDRLYALKPDQLQLGFLKVLKGSPIYESCREYGISYTNYPPYEVLFTKWLSYEDIRLLKKVEEMVEIYYNSNQFTHTLAVLSKRFSSPFQMFYELSLFYEKRGYFINSPKRGYRYDVLLQFISEKGLNYDSLYEELLTYDVYARENVKSRPEFSADIANYSDSIREFYIKEQKERKYLPEYAEYNSRQLQRMTHLEPFFYPVWDLRELYEAEYDKIIKNKKETFILFDYSSYNPVNHEAAIQICIKDEADV